MNKNKPNNLLKALLLSSALVTVSGQANAEVLYTGDQKIQNLINSIDLIDNRLQLSVNLGIGAVGYAEVGGVIVDGVFDEAKITEALLLAYEDARADVLTHDYSTATTAEQLFIQEHDAAMYNLSLAVDTLTDATSILMTATSVNAAAETADTRPEQVALQGMLEQDEYTIDGTKVDAYNDALDAVESYAQQAGAFLAAANNTELTASIDSYAQQNNFVVGSYSAITYTQSIDEFVITWDGAGFNSGWQGYLTDDFKDAADVFGASQYILQNGSPSGNM